MARKTYNLSFETSLIERLDRWCEGREPRASRSGAAALAIEKFLAEEGMHSKAKRKASRDARDRAERS